MSNVSSSVCVFLYTNITQHALKHVKRNESAQITLTTTTAAAAAAATAATTTNNNNINNNNNNNDDEDDDAKSLLSMNNIEICL